MSKKKKVPQRYRLLDYLNTGKSITRITAFYDVGIFELAARIGDLEKEGHVFNRPRVKVTNRFGETISVVEYSKKKLN